MKPGIYDIPAAEYHADPCPEPSLSSGIARILLSKSPRHAWHAHPRLNPAHEPEDSTDFDIGQAAHQVMLRDPSKVLAIIDADDWRTKAAKEARAEAIAAGRLPLLRDQSRRVAAMHVAVETQLLGHEAEGAFANGKPEQTLIWQDDGGIWCRARLDWLPDERRSPLVLYDFKTSYSANPDVWTRTLYNDDGDVQAAFYARGIEAVLGITDVRFRFVVVETAPPHCMSVIELDPAAVALARARMSYAMQTWRECLRANKWPGYPARVCHVETPTFVAYRWQERTERDRATQSQLTVAKEFQAP